jgi:hypothetical protein
VLPQARVYAVISDYWPNEKATAHGLWQWQSQSFALFVASVKCNPPRSYLMQSALSPHRLMMATQSIHTDLHLGMDGQLIRTIQR